MVGVGQHGCRCGGCGWDGIDRVGGGVEQHEGCCQCPM